MTMWMNGIKKVKFNFTIEILPYVCIFKWYLINWNACQNKNSYIVYEQWTYSLKSKQMHKERFQENVTEVHITATTQNNLSQQTKPQLNYIGKLSSSVNRSANVIRALSRCQHIFFFTFIWKIWTIWSCFRGK